MQGVEKANSVPILARVAHHRRWLIPAAAIAVVLVLGAFKISGSSVAMYETGSADTDVLVGRERPIRSDEWWVRLSSVVRQDATNFAPLTELGIGIHDVGTLNSLPIKSLDVVVRPHALIYFALPIEQAYATEWWFALFLPMAGFYLLFVKFGLRRMPAALASTIFAFSPFTQWWTNPDHGIILGYSSLGAAALIHALGFVEWRRRIAFAILSGWLFSCSAASLYLPHMMQAYVLMIGVYSAATIIAVSEGRTTVTRSLINGLLAAAAAVVVFGIFFVRHRAAFAALSSTVYPGRRSVDGGGGNLVSLLGAPYNRAVASPINPTINGLNASEFSAGVFLWWPAAIVAAITFSRNKLRSSWAALGVLSAIVGCFVAWFALPIPKLYAELTTFDSIPGHRMQFGIAVGGILAFGLALRELQNTPIARRQIAFAVASFYLITVLAGSRLVINDRPLSAGTVFLLPIAITLGIGFALGRRTTLGLAIIVAVLAWSAAFVNPIQYGLGPLLKHPVRTALVQLHAADPSAAALLSDADATVMGAASASGIPLIGGVSFYPSPDAWHVFDPASEQQGVWNRYATVLVTHADEQSSGTISLIQDDTILLALSPCDPRLQLFGVKYVVTQAVLTDTCLSTLETVQSGPIHVTIYLIDWPN